jgi:hypothetical protein
MNKKIAKMWTEALRSKKYHKTTGALKVVKDGKSKFSALGVLCDLYQQNHKKKLKEVPSKDIESIRRGWRLVCLEGHWDNGVRGGLWNRPAMPDKVMKWAGIKSDKCEFMLSDESAKLIRFPLRHLPHSIPKLNDMEVGMNFKKIARIIEMHHEDL